MSHSIIAQMTSPGKQPSDSKKSLYTLTLTSAQMEKLNDALRSRDWTPKVVAHAVFAYESSRVQVVGYKSGKLVVQGKGTEDFVQNILEPEVTGEARLGYDEIHHPEWFELHAGADEAGKGDVFGPLVTACVVTGGEAVKSLIDAGVRDSKLLSDARVLALDKIIRSTEGVTVGVAQASMERYNELMAKEGANLNKLLAWLHSRSIGDALKERPAKWGVLDQFATRDSVDHYLSRPDFRLDRRTKAEADPVVAAASIVARAGYLRGLKALTEIAGEPLMKGASAAAQAQFARLRDKLGADAMTHLAKLHFKLRSL